MFLLLSEEPKWVRSPPFFPPLSPFPSPLSPTLSSPLLFPLGFSHRLCGLRLSGTPSTQNRSTKQYCSPLWAYVSCSYMEWLLSTLEPSHARDYIYLYIGPKYIIILCCIAIYNVFPHIITAACKTSVRSYWSEHAITFLFCICCVYTSMLMIHMQHEQDMWIHHYWIATVTVCVMKK